MNNKTELTVYRAKDRRCYYGCPSDDLALEWIHTKKLKERLKAIDRTACVTYFPAEGKYLSFTNSNILENPDLEGPPKILTNIFHDTIQSALIEAITILETQLKG